MAKKFINQDGQRAKEEEQVEFVGENDDLDALSQSVPHV